MIKLMKTSMAQTIEKLSVDSIKPNPYQPRKTFNKASLEDLCQSIQNYGVLQPISVRKIGESGYELVAGERRLRAATMAGLGEIPAIIVDFIDQDSAVVALIENLQREDLNFFEEAEGYFNLINDHGINQEEVAKRVGKNQSTVANKIRLLRLAPEVKQIISDFSLTERHARALLRLPDTELQLKILSEVCKKNLNVKATEDIIEKMMQKISEPKEEEKKRNIRGVFNFKIYVNTLKNTFNAIKETGIDATFEQKDAGEYIEVVVKIPKNTKLN
jgi:ParB family transcriptional regulator, chromosome partitioning protein